MYGCTTAFKSVSARNRLLRNLNAPVSNTLKQKIPLKIFVKWEVGCAAVTKMRHLKAYKIKAAIMFCKVCYQFWTATIIHTF
jgi:hypothetical protein